MRLTVNYLINEAVAFSEWFSTLNHVKLIGVTDGKAVGTYVEHAFQNYLNERYDMSVGSSALGIDLPSVNTDIKTTSIVQPQSSCPFKSARQKIFGLGYNLLVFVYHKEDTADEIFKNPPEQGYLTISNALQWRLQYKRVITLDNQIQGVVNFVWK